MAPDDLKKSIVALFENFHIRLTPSDLERLVCRSSPGCSHRSVRSAIKEMVTEGILSYSNHFNTTHLELNFCRPVKISPRIILMPDGRGCLPTDGATQIIRLIQGDAFGIGDHPTTRLALRAVDSIMSAMMSGSLRDCIRVLDIGTGSGVLALAAAKLGAAKVVAMDIDTLALHEARNNILLNALEGKIVVTGKPLENFAGTSFDLIMANLRPPTLRQILPKVEGLSTKNSYWILSGFRQDAMEDVSRMLPTEKCEVFGWEATCGWGAMTVKYLHSKEWLKNNCI